MIHGTAAGATVYYLPSEGEGMKNEFTKDMEKKYGIFIGDKLICIDPRKGKRDWFIKEYGGPNIIIEDVEESAFMGASNIMMKGSWAYVIRTENGKRKYLDRSDIQYFKKEEVV